MLIYLSHPIDRVKSAASFRIDEAVAVIDEHIRGSGHVLFKPKESFTVGAHAIPDATIEAINRTAQSQASAVLVLWPDQATSWGVPVEVERALNAGQPVAFLYDGTKTWSMPTAWNQSPLFKAFAFQVEANLVEALHWLDQAVLESAKISEHGIPTKLLSESARIPTRAYSDDAGFDLYISEERTIQPGEFVDVPTSVAMELPPDTWLLLTGRSSTLRKLGLMVNQGIIDPGYRGELYAGVWNLSRKAVHLKVGDRVAQAIPMSNQALRMRLYEVDQLKPHPRGENGFGSSGQ